MSAAATDSSACVFGLFLELQGSDEGTPTP